jgi:hypothetical protein
MQWNFSFSAGIKTRAKVQQRQSAGLSFQRILGETDVFVEGAAKLPNYSLNVFFRSRCNRLLAQLLNPVFRKAGHARILILKPQRPSKGTSVIFSGRISRLQTLIL